jgi:HK97 family phage prohead protease
MSIAGMNFIRSAAAAPSSEQRQPMAGDRAQRFAAFAPNSYNVAARTIDAILSAGSAVQRGFGTEELEISSAAVDLSRAAAGLVPLLDAHNQFEADGVIGAVSNVRIVDGRLVGTLTFGQTPRAQAVEGMVARGELRGVSIGYVVQTWEAQQGQDTWRATRWQLLEVSLVPVPADVLTGFRSEAALQTENEEEDMLTRNEPGAPPVVAPAASPAGAHLTRFSASQALDFIRMGREFRVESAAEELVRRNEAGEIGTEAASDSLLRAAAERQRADVGGIYGGGTIHSDRTFDNPTFHARAIEDAIYSRLSGKAPSDEARQLRGLSMVALASDMLSRVGVRDVHRMSPDAILNAAAWNSNGGRSMPREARFDRGVFNTTSDFPDLLTSAGNRHLLDQFAAAASVIKTVSRERSAPDFREVSGLQLSAFGTLPEVTESGEIKHGTFESRKETYKLGTFAKIFALSRQAIINDDLGAFAQSATIMGRAAAETEAQTFAALINSNPVMSDSVALFHATHGNLAGTGAAPDVTTLDAGRLAMRSQLDYDGETPLAAAPAYILAGPKRETAIEQLLVATINPTQATDTNPFHGKLVPLIDPRLDADPWYLFADPGMVPVLEHAYLNGVGGPTVEMRQAWNTLGQEFRVYMDFGAGVVDHRGAFKNPGA